MKVQREFEVWHERSAERLFCFRELWQGAAIHSERLN